MRSREAISENNELKMPFVVAQRSSDSLEGENTNGKRSNNFGADGVRLASGTPMFLAAILWVVYNLRLDFKDNKLLSRHSNKEAQLPPKPCSFLVAL